MNLQSCESCGIVVDFDVYGLLREEYHNHDGDMVTEAAICPVCKGRIVDQDTWRKVKC